MDVEWIITIEAIISIVLTIVIVVQRRIITKLTLQVVKLLKDRENSWNAGSKSQSSQDTPSATTEE